MKRTTRTTAVLLFLLGLLSAYLYTQIQYTPEKEAAPPYPSSIPVPSANAPPPDRRVPQQHSSRVPKGAAGRARVQAIIDNLEISKARLSGPKELTVSEASVIELTLADTIEELNSQYKENGAYTTSSVKVSQEMEASLKSLDGLVEINPAARIKQAVGMEPTKWVWGVKPLKAGKSRLHAELWAIISIDGEDSKRKVKTFDYQIVVTISRADQIGLFLKEHWKWGFTALLLPIGKWAWSRKKPSQK